MYFESEYFWSVSTAILVVKEGGRSKEGGFNNIRGERSGMCCLFLPLPPKSENSTRDGDIRKAKSRSTVAVYLNFGAIVFAFLASDLILGLVLGLYRRPRVGVEEVWYGNVISV